MGSELQDAVDAVFARPGEQGISLALLVLVGGEVVAERYGRQPANAFQDALDVGTDTTLISWSTAKSMVHAAVGLLVADGRLDPAAPAPVPEWAGTPKAAIRLIDLLEMRPGLRFVEDYVDGEVSDCLEMLYGAASADMAAYAAGLPFDHAPGTVWNYSSGTTNIVCRIVGDVVNGGPGGTPAGRRAAMEEFLHGRLFGPLGMTTAAPKFDDAGTWVGSSYVYATARDFAKFGELYRNDGVLPDGTGVLPPGWADHARTFAAHDAGDGLLPNGVDYGRHWWMWPEYPGCVVAQGYEGQYVAVVPDRQLTLVHLGKTAADQRHHLVRLLYRVVDAVAVVPDASA
ncbi:MAG TPA: serine hydrolase domain-containing protein [Ilumatobacter sp.]|nr:serine hydrolase domain-containing protein [Ilumatobacter sp.]